MTTAAPTDDTADAATPPPALPPSPSSPTRAAWTRRALWANLVAQIGIIVTGGAVRLTGSGLGCSTWPNCEPGSFTPVFHDELPIHAAIEFGNRTLTGVLVAFAAAVAWLVWTDRTRPEAYRRLALAPLVGVVAQALIGGATVLLHLHPAIVGVHMLVSLGLVAVSTVLVVRYADDGAYRRVVSRPTAGIVAGLVAAGLVLLVLGIVTTGSGPHSGDDSYITRFALDPVAMARVHAAAVWVFTALLVAGLVAVHRGRAPRRTRWAWYTLLGVTLAQGGIGYAQFFAGLPILLVGIHLFGAGVLVAALTWVACTVWAPQARTPELTGGAIADEDGAWHSRVGSSQAGNDVESSRG